METFNLISTKDCSYNAHSLCHRYGGQKCEDVTYPCMFKKYAKEVTPELVKVYFEQPHSPVENHPQCIYSVELISFEIPGWFYKYIWTQLKHRVRGRIHNTLCTRHRKAKTLQNLKKQFAREINKTLAWNEIEGNKS